MKNNLKLLSIFLPKSPPMPQSGLTKRDQPKVLSGSDLINNKDSVEKKISLFPPSTHLEKDIEERKGKKIQQRGPWDGSVD